MTMSLTFLAINIEDSRSGGVAHFGQAYIVPIKA